MNFLFGCPLLPCTRIPVPLTRSKPKPATCQKQNRSPTLSMCHCVSHACAATLTKHRRVAPEEDGRVLRCILVAAEGATCGTRNAPPQRGAPNKIITQRWGILPRQDKDRYFSLAHRCDRRSGSRAPAPSPSATTKKLPNKTIVSVSARNKTIASSVVRFLLYLPRRKVDDVLKTKLLALLRELCAAQRSIHHPIKLSARV